MDTPTRPAHRIRAFILAATLGTANALANNFTMSDAFDGTEPQMPTSGERCPGANSLGYKVLGEITVSAPGDFLIADVGNQLSYEEPASGIADIVILVYDGPFDAGSPAANRHAVVDSAVGTGVNLQPGTQYPVVVQHWCTNQAGAFAVLIRGNGTVSGAGFESRPQNRGSWGTVFNEANFPGFGFSLYVVDGPRQVDRSGYYYFEDMWFYELYDDFSDFALAIYEGSFSPINATENLVTIIDDAGGVFLEAGQDYVFVPFDAYPGDNNWQYVWFPPGAMNFNPGLNAAWYNALTAGQGVFLDVGRESNFVFLSVFSFEEANASPFQAMSVGSADQRWLTAYGVAQPGVNSLDISYENSTGGAFNRPNSEYPVETDSNYGTGTLEAVDCDHLNLTYQLPGGLEGEMQMVRAIPEPPVVCASMVPAGPVTE